MSARRAAAKRTRRLVRWGGAGAAIIGLAAIIGPARAALLAPAVGMIWCLIRLPRIERRVFGPSSPAVLVRPEVIVREAPRPAAEPGLGAEGHRAYARALHAVTAAYLAECEREAQR